MTTPFSGGLLNDWDSPSPADNNKASVKDVKKDTAPTAHPQQITLLHSSTEPLQNAANVAPSHPSARAKASSDGQTPAVTQPASHRAGAASPATAASQSGATDRDIAPVSASDKRVVNAKTDINQLVPFRYPWAWDFFIKANHNHWTPLEINMSHDVHDYTHKLTPQERHVFENVLAYLTTSDILAMRNIGLAVMEKMTAPELQIYQARQVYEEALHTWTYQHCIESIGLEQLEIYNRYRVVPEIHGKIQLANQKLNQVLRSDIDLTQRDNLEAFAMSYIFFAAIFEGCWFYNGFSPIFALQRRGLMKGTAEQFQYIMRDEVLHCSFGIRVIRELLEEENITIDPRALRDLWDEVEAAEERYAGYILAEPILGYNKDLHIGQFRYVANRRARQLGFTEPFPGAENVLPWLDEQANLRKEKNFLETRVTEYQTGGALNWE